MRPLCNKHPCNNAIVVECGYIYGLGIIFMCEVECICEQNGAILMGLM